MSVYVITGVSRGMGVSLPCAVFSVLPLLNPAQFGFVKQLSEAPENLVIGLVRDNVATEKKVAAELGGRTNIHILNGDLTSRASLKQAAADTAKIVSDRGVDYLIANGAYLPLFDAFGPIGDLYVFRSTAGYS